MKIYKILLVIVLFLLIIFNSFIKDSYNKLMGIFESNKEIYIEDDMIHTYINGLEREISNFKSIESIDNCINGRVIYRNPSYWYDTFVINKGAIDGINKNDLVINEKGLVGVISEIYDNSSDVSLITNINKNKIITVGITNNEDTIYGTIRKYNKIKKELIIEELTSDIDGELDVITTSFTDTFKENILIGKVKEIKNNSNGLSKYAVVTPIVDYNNIKYVCVIKNDNI